MINKALLTGAFEKMGPERVQMMLGAFGPRGEWDNYCRCALGFAAGYDHKTERELWRDCGTLNTQKFLAQKIGISIQEADAIEEIHIGFPRLNVATISHFVALANEWLENRPASLHAATRETAVSVGAGPTTETPQP